MDIYNGAYARRKSYAKISEVHATPNLIEVQLRSFHWFMEEGLQEIFNEVSPIQSFDGHLELHFLGYHFGEPRYGEDECRERDMTYAAPLRVQVRLDNKETDEKIVQEVFMGDFPLMTSKGTFIVNGAERVVVSQLIRSPGAYFTLEEERVSGRQLCMAKLIPDRGAWLEFESSKRDVLSVKVDRRRKFPVTELLRAALGLDQEDKGQSGQDEDLLRLFAEVESSDPEHHYIAATIERDATKNAAEALLDIHRKMRPGEPPTPENAARYLQFLLFDARHYDLGRVGRYKFNKRLGISESVRHLTVPDLARMVETMIRINNRLEGPDDIDHLGNRRIKTVGELIQNQLRIGLLRLERVVRERMSTRETEGITPLALVNVRPIVAILRQFFGGSQLSQFMDQTNPLAELNHKRRVSALGPGGLRRERAGFDVRDVHHSHYGRICPIETPEGPNIGLIGTLATYARVNDYGFIETPYRRVVRSVPNEYEALVGTTLREPVAHPETREKVAETGAVVDEELARRLAALPPCQIPIRPRVTGEVVYLTADEEDKYYIAQANSPLNERGEFVEGRASVRYQQRFMTATLDRVDFMDVSPKQAVGVSAALIPFLEHDDANRALMGANMQRQAVPLLRPDAPVVGTGMEFQAALDSGQLLIAKKVGEVLSADSRRIVIDHGDEIASYPLVKYRRSNQSTCISQRPVVSRSDRVEAGQVIADSFSTEEGLLALGQDVLVAFMLWEGGNFEDAVVVSESLIWQDKFTSIHIEEHELEARDTQLGPEEITRDIPNVGEDALRDLDESGVIRIGASVFPGDILVGKITPKGEAELTPEEKLLRAIFGEKAREVRDSSLKLPHGEKGKVVDIHTFTREDHPDLPVGVDRMVRVSIAERRKLTEGDKMAGRHGNKGVISKVVPVEDMPYLADGTPVEIILNPLGVPSRMNIGQVFETHLGWAAKCLGFKTLSPVFDGADEAEITAELARSWLMDQAWAELTTRAWEWLKERDYASEEIRDDEEVRLLYLEQTLEDTSREILGDRTRARRAFLRKWLAERGYDFDELFVLEGDGRNLSERLESDRKVIGVCLRLWMEHHGRAPHEGPAFVGTPHGFEAEGLSAEELLEAARKASRESGWSLPISGKAILYDGKTGQPFDLPVTVGIISMMKLDHLVEDKVHARSTGPYSLVTQQPLGGKAQFGGQRFGEMEVWALEAYGAAYILQEMLTIKSDDVIGRTKTYEAIVKGEEIRGTGIPESFNVLVKELQSLGLAVEVMDAKGQKVELGGKETEAAVPKFGLGLI